MSSDEALKRNSVTTESENQETASSPEQTTPESSSPENASAESAPPDSEAVPTDAPPKAEPPVSDDASKTADQETASDAESTGGGQEASGEPAAANPPEPVAAEPHSEETETAAESNPSAATDDTSSPSAPEEGSSESSPPTQSEPARPRPQLNPTVDPNAVRPVPNLESPPSSPPSQPQPEEDGSAPIAPPSAEAVPPSMPAEIPKSGDLDAELEAEIAAAQATDEASGSQPVPAPQAPAGETPEGTPAPKPEAPPAPTSEEELEPGYRMNGKVQSVTGDDVFFDLGFRSPALVSLRQFDPAKPPEVGQSYQIVIDKVNAAEGLIHANLPRGRRKIQGNWDAVEVGQVVDCMVTKTNKGGLEITVSNLRGFLPASQVDMYYVPDLEKYVGEKLTVKITEANRAKKNLIVSRRAYLKEEREAQAAEIWTTLEVGQAKKGTVKTIKDYGAFVDIGGVDGFLHIGEISWTRIRHPSDVLSEGQDVDVQILSLDPDRKRIGLGMRQLSQNPWDSATQNYAQGTTVSGKVTRTTDFGAFVELEPGVEGLVHISELDYRRVNKVTDVLNVGDETELKVLDLDLKRKRISLSLKALKDKPPEFDKKKSPKKSDEDLAPSGGEAYDRRRKGPLKGGTGGESDGGLFGNPGDFS